MRSQTGRRPRAAFASAFAALVLSGPVHGQLAPPSAAGVSFAHVHLNVVDPQVHRALWIEHFGAVPVEPVESTAVKLPGMLVMFFERPPTGDSGGSSVDHVGLLVRDLVATLASWRDAGLEVEAEFAGGEGTDNAFLLAPDGVRIELQEDTTLASTAEAYHVHIYHERYAELLDWYVDLIGAVKRPRGDIETTADVPGINLSFSDSDTERAPTSGRAIDHIGLEIDGLEAFCEALEARGIEFEIPYRVLEDRGVAIAFVIDPVGTRVELSEGLDTF
ncbi:MAG: VOC family protein [Gemmatimonadetes bacterium]|nr:VOC family protein [Gemmatimonadota bacterium]